MRTNKSRQKRYTRSSLTGLILGGLILVFLLALAGGAYLMSTWGRRSVQAPEAVTTQEPGAAEAQPAAGAEPGAEAQPAEQPDVQPAQGVGSRITLVVMGVDNRPDEPVGRTDSIMVLTIDPQTGATGMLSVARDLLVVVPGSTQRVKINTVHAIGEIDKYPGGGPALLAETMSSLLGYPVDHYVRINFDGFRQIIDQMGGVDIDVPVAINDPLFPDNAYGYDPLYIPAGHVHMDGTLALKFARTRHIDSDYGRERRQQQLVLAIKEKLTQPGELARMLPRLPSMALTMANTVQTDMPIDQAIALATRLSQADLQTPTSVVVDNAMGREENDPTLGFILVPDLTKIRAAAAQIFANTPSVQTAGAQVTATPAAAGRASPVCGDSHIDPPGQRGDPERHAGQRVGHEGGSRPGSRWLYHRGHQRCR